MKACAILIFVLLYITTVQSSILAEIENNATFIEDVKIFLKLTHVIILYDDNSDSVNENIFVFKICRLLILKRIQAVTLKLTDQHFFNILYEKRENMPLIIVYLSEYESLEKFEKFSEKVNMKWGVWLVIFMDKYKTWNYCHNPPRNIFNLSFNSKVIVKCYGDKVLHEWFSVDKNRVEVKNSLASWDPKNHLSNITKYGYFTRRHNFQGKNLKTVTLKKKEQVRSKSLELHMEVLKLLGQLMNFTYSTISEESQYGTFENGVWTGVMNKTSSGEADIAAVGLSMTEKRMCCVDFTLPLLNSYKALYFRQPNGTQIQRFGYFQAFHKHVWGVLILLLITIPMCLTCLMIERENCSMTFLFQENFFDVWRIYCQQGILVFPKRGSLRIVYFVTFMLSLILLSAYSATIISHLAVASPNLPFNSVKEFARQNAYKLIVINKGETLDSLKNSENIFSIRMRRLLKNEKSLPSSFSEGFNMICKDGYSVFLVEQSAEAIIDEFKLCQLKKVTTRTKISLAMSLPKNSPYTGVFNYQILRLKEFGVLSRIVPENTKTNVDSKLQNAEAVSIERVDTIFSIIIYALILSIIILIFEKIHFHCCEKRDRQKRNQIIANFNHRVR